MFKKTKYIIDSDGNYMIFSNGIHHDTACAAMQRHCRFECVGAGFVIIGPNGVHCSGYSETLGIKSRGDLDSNMIALALNLPPVTD